MDIRKGDIFYVMGGKTYAGYNPLSEDGRPAIIVSNDLMNKTSDYVMVVYLTTQEKKPLSTHCEIICKQKSTAMCETIYTINKSRLGDYMKTITNEEMSSLNECLLDSIGLSYYSDFSEDADYSTLQDELDTLRSKNARLTQELAQSKDTSSITTERDLYKRLYEQLLDKAVG